MIRIKSSKVLLSVIAVGLLSACASNIPTAKERSIINNGTKQSTRTNYNEVTVDGEYVSDSSIYAMYKYRNLIWKCNHGTKICEKN